VISAYDSDLVYRRNALDLPNNIMWAPRQQLTQKPETILRCMKMRGGRIACSGFQT
jgi:hypothetical protein